MRCLGILLSLFGTIGLILYISIVQNVSQHLTMVTGYSTVYTFVPSWFLVLKDLMQGCFESKTRVNSENPGLQGQNPFF